MQRYLFTIAVAFFCHLSALSSAQAQLGDEFFGSEVTTSPKESADPVESQSSNCGTLIDWVADNDTAFEQAKQAGKPIYMLHLSGNLKNDQFT